jgi:hypothetical protein
MSAGDANRGGHDVKITVDIDCTPEEARTFLGLPDLKPMQEELMREVQARMTANLKAMEPEEMMRLWLPVSMKSFEQMQEMFARMAGGKRD